MTIRTRQSTVTFRGSFVLAGFDEELPAGAYSVETDEELLDTVSFAAWRRVRAVIHLHASAGHPGRTRSLTIDPLELDAALTRDGLPAAVSWDTENTPHPRRPGRNKT